MNYYAIIGDIKESKKIENRYEVQEKLKDILDNVNRFYTDEIAAKFLITLGDEFQGLLKNPAHILDIIKYIQREMYPIKLRIGIGIGEMSTKINNNFAIGADGPAFYAARKMVETIHELEKKIRKQAPDIQISFYERDSFETVEVNMMLSLLKTIEDNWSEKQRRTIWNMMENPGSQEECADKMGTTQSTIARRLSDGKYVIYQRSIETIGKAICKLGDA